MKHPLLFILNVESQRLSNSIIKLNMALGKLGIEACNYISSRIPGKIISY